MKKMLAVVLAAVMLFSCTACSDKNDTDELVKNGDNVVATAYGTDITKHQIYANLVAYINNYNMTLADLEDDPALVEKLKTDFVNDMVLEFVIPENAADLGYEFDSSEEGSFEAQYDLFLEQLDENNRLNALTDGASGQEEIAEKAIELRDRYFTAMGYTAETYKDRQRRYYITKRTQEAATVDEDMTEEELRGHYDSLLAIEQQSLELSATDSPFSSSLTLYCVDGYKYVKPLYLKFEPEVILNAATLYSESETDKLNSLLERETTRMQDKIEEVRAKIDAGADFDALIEEYGNDDGMTLEPYKTEGYFTATGDSNQYPSYQEAADRLTKVGDVQECVTYKGYWFLYANEVVDEGPVPYEEIRSILKSKLMTEKKAQTWDTITRDLLEKSIASGDVVIDMEKFDI